MTPNYETPSPDPWPDAVQVDGWNGIAFHVYGYETEPDEDTEWSGYEVRTGNLVVCMVGDDLLHSVDPDDVHELPREGYCGECGQIGCRHDGYEREA